MAMNTYLFFILISMSGAFAVTFTVVFAYVADITTDEDRSSAYGLVSATFAASLVISPALGAYISQVYGDLLVVLLATLIAVLDVAFIYYLVPESLSEKTVKQQQQSRHEANQKMTGDGTGGCGTSFNPLSSLRKVMDPMILILCLAVFLSYLPEAGQYSCFFVYIRLVLGFTGEDVALFIAVIGLLSVIAQTGMLSCLMLTFTHKTTIMIGLACQMAQLFLYGVSRDMTVLWFAGILAAASSITYPAISCYVSTHADPDKQGLVQGLITGVRGLCNGLGPALFGFTFDLFNVDLSNEELLSHPMTGLAQGVQRDHILGKSHHSPSTLLPGGSNASSHHLNFSPSSINSSLLSNGFRLQDSHSDPLIPGPPFVFGSLMVMLAMIVTTMIPQVVQYKMMPSTDLFGSSGSGGGGGGSSTSSSSSPASRKNGSKAYPKYYYTHVLGESDPVMNRSEGDKMMDEEGMESVSPSPTAAERSFVGFKVGTRLRSKTSVELSIPLIGNEGEAL